MDIAALDGTVGLDDLAGRERVVRAGFLRVVLLGLEPSCRRVGVRGGRISGVLDLEACVLPCALTIEDAELDSEVVVRRARLPRLELADCTMPRLSAPRMALEHALVLRGSTFEHGIDLDGAALPGGLDCRGVSMPAGGLTFVRGSADEVLLSEQFSAAGPVDLEGTTIQGELDCTRATLKAPGGVALSLVGGEAAAVLLAEIACTGGVRLSRCTISGAVVCSGTFDNEGGWVLDLAESQARAVFLGSTECPLECRGGVDLSGANITTLTYDVGRLERPGGVALSLTGAHVADSVQLYELVTVGEVDLRSASIGTLVCMGARLDNAGGVALGGLSTQAGDVFIRRSELLGQVILVQPRVTNRFSVSDSTLSHPDGYALVVTQANIGRAFELSNVSVTGGVDLAHTQVQTLDDDLGRGADGLGSWAGASPLWLDGFSFQRFGVGVDSTDHRRHAWLRGTSVYQPAAWRALADAYRQSGMDREATSTAIAMENDRLARGRLPLPRKLGRWVLRVTIGHGYRPWLAGAWALAVIATFATLVSLEKDRFTPASDGDPSLQPLAYAVDTFLPVIDLGVADQWTATGWVTWAEWTVILIGWALTTLFVAGFTRVVRS